MKIVLRILFYLSITPIFIPIISIVRIVIQLHALGIPSNSYYIMYAIFTPQNLFPFLERFPIIYYFPVFIIYIFGFVLFILSGLFIILEKKRAKKNY